MSHFSMDERWYWKLLAVSSSWSLLVGYLVFPLALGEDEDGVRISAVGLIAFGSVTIAVAYTISVVLSYFGRQAFLLESVYIPFFGSSLIGLANATFNILCRNLLPLSRLATVIISLSAVSTAVYCSAALYTGWKVHVRNEQRRLHMRNCWSNDGTALLTDDEMQRQQLLKLLQSKSDKAPSPEAIQSTFRIDLPDTSSPQRGRVLFTPFDAHGLPTLYAYGEQPVSWIRTDHRLTRAHSSPEPSPQSRERRRAQIEGQTS